MRFLGPNAVAEPVVGSSVRGVFPANRLDRIPNNCSVGSFYGTNVVYCKQKSGGMSEDTQFKA